MNSNNSQIVGCSSSPGIYDRTAELVLSLSCHIAGLPRSSFIRQLDDCIGDNCETYFSGVEINVYLLRCGQLV